MNIDEALRGVTRLFLDTAPVIYYVEKNEQYAALVQTVFDQVDAGTMKSLPSAQPNSGRATIWSWMMPFKSLRPLLPNAMPY